MSAFVRNDGLYSEVLSSVIIQACIFIAGDETSTELDRDLPPGIQLLRMRPLDGLWVALLGEDTRELGRGIGGGGMDGGALISVTESVGWEETLRPLASATGIVILGRMPGTGIEGPAW